MRCRSLLSLSALVPALVAAAPPADAPLVLDVAGAPDVDAAAVRDAVATETHRPVVVATGEVPARADRVVVVTRDGRLRVKVLLRPAERDVALEREADRVKQIARLVGSLTRNDSADSEPPPTPAAPTSPAPLVTPTPWRDPESELAYRRLEWVLKGQSEGATPALVTGVLLGSLAAPLGVFVREQVRESGVGFGVLTFGTAWAFLGGMVLVLSTTRGAYGELYAQLVHARDEDGMASAVTKTEASWLRAARQERLLRRVVGGVGVGVGTLSLGLGAAFVLSGSGSSEERGRGAVGALTMAIGGLSVLLGVHAWCAPGRVETGYEAYRRTSGRMQLTPSVAVVPGGGAISFGATF